LLNPLECGGSVVFPDTVSEATASQHVKGIF